MLSHTGRMKLQPYYKAQEPEYRRIRESGEAGWLVKSFDQFRDPVVQKLLEDVVEAYFSVGNFYSALDLGTGTGFSAHILYDLGFEVTAIDVCPSAIEYAKEIAATWKRKINFLVADGLSFKGSYDFIYDSHCLHCVVFEEDRRALLLNIKKSLNPGGVFLLDTMVLPVGVKSWDTKGKLKFDEEFILWHPVSQESHTGVLKEGEAFWCPQRRIYPVDKILSEVKVLGFDVISTSILNEDEGIVMLRAVLKVPSP